MEERRPCGGRKRRDRTRPSPNWDARFITGTAVSKGEGHVGPALRQKRPLATDATVVATPADVSSDCCGVTAGRDRHFTT